MTKLLIVHLVMFSNDLSSSLSRILIWILMFFANMCFHLARRSFSAVKVTYVYSLIKLFHTHAHTCTYTCTHMHTRMHMHARTHMHTHTYTHMHAHTHTHTHTHTHACTHTHIHTLLQGVLKPNCSSNYSSSGWEPFSKFLSGWHQLE